MIELGSAEFARPALEGVGQPSEGVDAVQRLRSFVDTTFDFVWRSLRRLGVPEAAVDDAAQKVYSIVLLRIGDISPGRERSFLFGTVLRVAADTRRELARARERFDDSAVEDAVDPAPTPDQIVDDKRARELLDEVLDGMDDSLRAVFVLFEIEGLTAREIASLLEIPAGTAASRLRRAREQFHAAAKRIRARAALCKGES